MKNLRSHSPNPARLTLATLIIVVCLSPRAGAEWTLVTADFQARQVALREIDEQGISITDRADSTMTKLSWDKVLQLQRVSTTKEPTRRFIAQTAAGDRLVGEPLMLENESLKWSSPLLGEVTLALASLRQIHVAGKTIAPAPSDQTEDLITLANGDQVRGIVTDISDTTVTISVGGDSVAVPLDSIHAVRFVTTARRSRSSERHFRVRLSDGSSIASDALRLADQQLSFQFPRQTERKIDIASVAMIEQVNGPVVWLSALEPEENVHTPFFEILRPAQMDRTVLGEPIRFGEHTFARGIGVYPYSRLSWKLDGTHGAFRTRYAIDGDLPYASVTVRIRLDHRIVHEREEVTAGELSPIVLIPVGDAKLLTLEVDWGRHYSVQDRFNWIEPALVKSPPVEQSNVVPLADPTGRMVSPARSP